MRILVPLLFLFCVPTWSQAQLLPEGQPVAIEKRTKGTEQNHGTSEHRQATSKEPLDGNPLAVDDRIESHLKENGPGAEAKEQLEINRRLADYTGHLARFTEYLVGVGVLQVLALLVQAGFFAHHGTLIRESVDQMKGAVTAYQEFVRTSQRMLALTRESNALTGKIAATAKESADAFIAGERAWVLVEGIKEPYLTEPYPFETISGGARFNEFVFNLVNRGKTVARLTGPFLYRFHSLARGQDLPDTPDYVGRTDPTRTVGKPAEPNPVYGRVLAPGDYNGLIPIQLGESVDENKIEQADIVLYVYGSLVYYDSFEKRRELRFGYTLSPRGFTGAPAWVQIRKEEYNRHT
jgi:hypothetical protein